MNEQEELLNIFIKDHDISEVSWRGENLDMCLMWIPYYDLEEFIELFEWYFETENEVQATLQKDGVCIDLVKVFGSAIDFEKWMPKEELQ